MKITGKILLLFTGLLLTASTFGYFFWYKPKFKKLIKKDAFTLLRVNAADHVETRLRLNQKAVQAKVYITNKSFDDERCFFIDMRIPSGKNRFFVYNLHHDSVEIAGLVTHGSGIQNNSDTPVFSNAPNSYCTSLGKYKIGRSYHGQFGLAYKLTGLDRTNNRAFERFVVMHAHECVPNSEVYPLTICESWGCPTVSPSFLLQ